MFGADMMRFFAVRFLIFIGLRRFGYCCVYIVFDLSFPICLVLLVRLQGAKGLVMRL